MTDETKGATNDNAELTVDDILRGGDEPAWPVKVPNMTKAGQAGTMYLRDMSALELLALAEIKEDDPEANRKRIRAIAKCISNRRGDRLFKSEDEVNRAQDVLDLGTFQVLFTAMMKRTGVEVAAKPTGQKPEDGGQAGNVGSSEAR